MIIYNKISAFIIIQLNNQQVKGAFKSLQVKTPLSLAFLLINYSRRSPTQPNLTKEAPSLSFISKQTYQCHRDNLCRDSFTEKEMGGALIFPRAKYDIN